jgi:hypothetical protein
LKLGILSVEKEMADNSSRVMTSKYDKSLRSRRPIRLARPAREGGTLQTEIVVGDVDIGKTLPAP